MSVGGDFAAELVGFFRNGLHLFQSVLGRARLIAFAEDSARGADLDEISAVLNGFADFGTRGPGAVGHAFGSVVKFRRKKIVIAVSAGNAQRRAGHAHARALDFAGINAIAQSDVRVTARSNIAHCGKASAERESSVLHTCNGFSWNGNAKARVAAARGFTGEMGVDINQPRETRGIRKINRTDAAQELRGRG